MTANRGKLLLGARPIAHHAFKDEKRWRSAFNDALQPELGLFMQFESPRVETVS
jgi:hypothetical protein